MNHEILGGEMKERTVVYVSGGMTKIPDWNRPAFNRARRYGEAKGYKMIIPGDGEIHTPEEDATWTPEPGHLRDYMRLDVESILQANQVWVLDGWENSQGSTFEVLIALELGIPVFTEFKGRLSRGDVRWWRPGTTGTHPQWKWQT